MARASSSDSTAEPFDSSESSGENTEVSEQDIEEQKAVAENPDNPEEVIETEYLVGGEVPANAPGTDGLTRERDVRDAEKAAEQESQQRQQTQQ